MLLKTAGLEISYNGIIALRDFDMAIEKGDSIAVLGPNGAGKSTLLRGIAGTVIPKKGTIYYEGEDITNLEPLERIKRSIILLPQGLDIFPSLTVKDNIELMVHELFGRKQKDKLVDEAFSLFKTLYEKRNVLAGNLSGGERRLVALSRALVSKPALLLLDEPSCGLSPVWMDAIFDKIVEIHEMMGTTIILVEQAVRRALEVTNKGYILVNGQLALVDDAKKLLKDERIVDVYFGNSSP